MKRYGCIGQKLTHSFSKEIHARLADYPYDLIELQEDEIQPFLEKRAFAAINVTIPYKQTVIPYLDAISDIAERIGAVNTIVNKDGRLFGYNTDYYGMKALIERIGISLQGKKVLILGTGGTAKTARVVATDLGAGEIWTVSRRKTDDHILYEEAIHRHADAEVIINTTPSGMYPDLDSTPIDIGCFPRLEGVVDAVYNPLCTNLVLDARARGIRAEGGLYMLVVQAASAVEKFLDTTLSQDAVEEVFTSILASKENVVLIGMPGCGKSTVGRLLHIDGYTWIDTDAEIEKRCGCRIREMIASRGERYFRDVESQVIDTAASQTGLIISTGGGAVLRDKNLRALRRNGKLFFIDTPLSRLCATEDRPLSDTNEKLADLYNQRIEIYKAAADVTVPYAETPQAAADYILSKRMEKHHDHTCN